MQAAQCPVEDEPRASPCGTGDVGTVVETFGTGEAFLVEFNKNGKAAKGECDWMGVLYPTEVELGTRPRQGLMPGRARCEAPQVVETT